jgi:small-conductance mechanosensitive channel
LSSAGIDLTALTVVFGAVGLGIGLGLQRVVGNLVAGLTLLIGKTIKPGDIIEYKNSYGWVSAMGARYVTMRTRDGVEHLIPNDYFLENGVENWSYSDVRLRLRIPVGIAYESDVRQAIALCIDAAKSVKRVLERPEPLCLLKGFGDSSIDLEIRAWIEDPRNGTQNVRSEVLLGVHDRFKEAGIKFPFPQRDVHIVSTPAGSGAPLL